MKQPKAESPEEKVDKLIGFTKYEKIGIISMLFIIVVSPILFSQFSSYFSFNNTGEIGDTIGGITAPFVNLLAAFLVYKSFSAQIQANAQQREDHNDQIKEIRKEYQFNYLRDLFSLISSEYHANSRDTNKESWVSSLILLIESYNDPQDWIKYNEIGIFIKRMSNDEIIESINDESLHKLETIKRHVNNIKIFANEIKNVQIESGLVEFYTLKIEEIIKDSDIWMLVEEQIQSVISKHNILHEYQRIQIEIIVEITNEIKNMDLAINPHY